MRAQRRERLLDAAYRVFLAEGYRGATMDRVADAAGVARQTLYNYFLDKELLFIALLEERKIEEGVSLARRIAEAPARSEPSRGLTDAFIALFTHAADGEGRGLFRLMMEVANDLPDLAARIHERVEQRGIAAVHAALVQEMTDGDGAIDHEAVAHLIYAAVTGYGLVQPVLLGVRRLPPERLALAMSKLLARTFVAERPPTPHLPRREPGDPPSPA